MTYAYFSKLVQFKELDDELTAFSRQGWEVFSVGPSERGLFLVIVRRQEGV